MNNEKNIGIVILNYNTYALTIKYIHDLRKQVNVNLSIVVVDNNSPNDSYKYLEKEFKTTKDVTVINSGKNGGYSFGNNIGVNFMLNKNVDYIFISNSDVIWENNNDWQKLTNAMDDAYNQSNIAFCTAVMEDKNGFGASAWKIPNIYYDLGMFFPILNTYLLKKFKSNTYQNNYLLSEVIPGSFFGAKKDIFDMFMPLDENVFLYCEERILAQEIKNKGYTNVIIPFVKYIHESSTTIDSVFSKKSKMKHVYKSVNYFHQKYNNQNIILRHALKLLQSLYLFSLSFTRGT